MKRYVLLFLLILLIYGCTGYTNIDEIRDNPQKFNDKAIMVKGRVTETISIPLIQKGLFQIDDNTGKIWVISNERVPFRGDRVTVKGLAKTGFVINDRTFGIIIVEDTNHREDDR